MRTTSRIAVAFIALLSTSSTALAGGIGIITNAGLHQERAYYYGGSQQALDTQSRPNYGVGLEGLIGDKDDKVQGMLRMSWVMDEGPVLPKEAKKAGATHPNYKDPEACKKAAENGRDRPEECNPNHVGVIALGVQWGVLGDPGGTQLVINSLVGSGFITTDNTEYVLVEAGVGGTHNFTDSLQAVVNLDLAMRNRKYISFGPAFHAGIRYLFD